MHLPFYDESSCFFLLCLYMVVMLVLAVPRAVVVAHETPGSLKGLVRQLSLDLFENESRRVSTGMNGDTLQRSLSGLQGGPTTREVGFRPH